MDPSGFREISSQLGAMVRDYERGRTTLPALLVALQALLAERMPATSPAKRRLDSAVDELGRAWSADVEGGDGTVTFEAEHRIQKALTELKRLLADLARDDGDGR